MSDKTLTAEQLEAKVRAEHGDAAWEAVKRGLGNYEPKMGRRRLKAGAKQLRRRSFVQWEKLGHSAEPNGVELERYRRLREEAGELPRRRLPRSGAPLPPKNPPPFRKRKQQVGDA